MGSNPDAETFVAARAATRVVGDTRIVCAVGWTTDVHQLGGAARIVWEIAQQPVTRRELAERAAVPVDDRNLGDAIRLLCDAGLLVTTDERAER